jgi:hypothetical protein
MLGMAQDLPDINPATSTPTFDHPITSTTSARVPSFHTVPRPFLPISSGVRPLVTGSDLALDRDAIMKKMMDTFDRAMDDSMMQAAVQEGHRLLEGFRKSWVEAIERTQVANITMLWKASLNRLPTKEEIESIMSHCARASVIEWQTSTGSPSSSVWSLQKEVDYETLLQPAGRSAAQAYQGEQSVPPPPVRQRDVSTQEPKTKRRKTNGDVKPSRK